MECRPTKRMDFSHHSVRHFSGGPPATNAISSSSFLSNMSSLHSSFVSSWGFMAAQKSPSMLSVRSWPLITKNASPSISSKNVDEFFLFFAFSSLQITFTRNLFSSASHGTHFWRNAIAAAVVTTGYWVCVLFTHIRGQNTTDVYAIFIIMCFFSGINVFFCAKSSFQLSKTSSLRPHDMFVFVDFL